MEFKNNTPGVKTDGEHVTIDFLKLPESILNRAMQEAEFAYDSQLTGKILKDNIESEQDSVMAPRRGEGVETGDDKLRRDRLLSVIADLRSGGGEISRDLALDLLQLL